MSTSHNSNADNLVGQPSDLVPAILAEGDSGIPIMWLSMATRHPEGGDAEYLRWHSLDHRPEQHRLSHVRASLRVVSTPACRAARAVSNPRWDTIDHVVAYFFSDLEGLDQFNRLSTALREAGRVPFVLPPVQRGVYAIHSRVAAPRAKAGADVMAARPTKGVYLLIEQGESSADSLVEVPGVAGLWSATSVPHPLAKIDSGQQVTYCFLDGDPVEVGNRLNSILKARWAKTGVIPLVAAPFHTVVPYEWERYLP
jgi:hypothetical protein